MAHVRTSGAALHHALQFAGDQLRIIFEWRPDGMLGEGNAADQDSRCDQIANQGVIR